VPVSLTFGRRITEAAELKISSEELADLLVEVAKQKFAGRSFERRPLMEAAEREVRRRGWWTSQDDRLSGSVGLKSRGLAAIDYRFSDLARRKIFVCERRNLWHLASGH
jgi:hypothetical protein